MEIIYKNIQTLRTILWCSFVLFVATPTAQANTIIYKFKGEDGVTVYTQTLSEKYRPADIQTISVETLPAEQQRAAIRMLAAMEEKIDAKLQLRRANFDNADRQIDAAIKNLLQSESDLKIGSIPDGNDRIGNKNGRSRLRESYFLRVSRLQTAVEHAKQALEEAYIRRNNLR